MDQLSMKDFYQYHFLSNLNYNPSGSAAAFVSAASNPEQNNYYTQLWLLKDGTTTKLIGDGKVKSYFWEDDIHILFNATRSADDEKLAAAGEVFTSFYRLNICGGEAEFAFRVPVIATQIKLLENGKYAVCGMLDVNYPDYCTMSSQERAKVAAAKKAEADYEVIDENPWWFNGVGMINKQRTALFVYDPTNNTTQRISAPTLRVGGMATIGNTIYYFGEDYTTRMDNRHQVICYQTETGETSVLLPPKYNISHINVLKDKLLLAATDGTRYGFCEAAYLYTLDPKNGAMQVLLATEEGVGNSVGSDCRLGATHALRVDGDTVYFTATIQNAAHLLKCTAAGEVSTVCGTEGSVDDFDVRDGKVLLIGLYNMKLQEVYRLGNGSPVCLTSFNTEILANKYVANPQKITINSCCWDIDGWVLLPKDYDQSKSYPAILDIHGGPKTVFGEVFYHEMQAWANMGYFVFFCNPFGSDGKSNEFGDLRGKYGTIDYQNIMDFTDAVLAKYPAIDQKRVAVTGGSYGGYMTNWIIGHTNRFCCAATQRSISNWISFYGISDIGILFGQDQCAADIFTQEGVEKLWEHSPLKYIANMETPTLFIHSDEDFRCPIAEGYQLYTALLDKGVKTRMCVFHGENHELSRGGKPQHRLRRLNEITDWIVQYTK